MDDQAPEFETLQVRFPAATLAYLRRIGASAAAPPDVVAGVLLAVYIDGMTQAEGARDDG